MQKLNSSLLYFKHFISNHFLYSYVFWLYVAVMKDYGYEIMESLVTDIRPDRKVMASMNEINASKRLKEAASHKAEAEKVR